MALEKIVCYSQIPKEKAFLTIQGNIETYVGLSGDNGNGSECTQEILLWF